MQSFILFVIDQPTSPQRFYIYVLEQKKLLTIRADRSCAESYNHDLERQDFFVRASNQVQYSKLCNNQDSSMSSNDPNTPKKIQNQESIPSPFKKKKKQPEQPQHQIQAEIQRSFKKKQPNKQYQETSKQQILIKSLQFEESPPKNMLPAKKQKKSKLNPKVAEEFEDPEKTEKNLPKQEQKPN